MSAPTSTENAGGEARCTCPERMDWDNDSSCEYPHDERTPEPAQGERERELEAFVRWIVGVTVHPDDAEVIPAAMSHMKCRVFAGFVKARAESLLTRSPVTTTPEEHVEACVIWIGGSCDCRTATEGGEDGGLR